MKNRTTLVLISFLFLSLIVYITRETPIINSFSGVVQKAFYYPRAFFYHAKIDIQNPFNFDRGNDLEKIKKENIILHVGRFRVIDETVGGAKDYKKQYVMIEAFRKMSRKMPDWKFVLAVSVKDDDRVDFDSLIREAKGHPIEFLVNKTNDKLWKQYSRAKIYWHASGFGEDLERHPEFAEHFGISTVEAMGAGAVPVVFNAGGQKEIVEDNINGFLWNTLSELEEKTLLLIRENKILEKIHSNTLFNCLFSKDTLLI